MKRFATVLSVVAVLSLVSVATSFAAEPTADDYIGFFKPLFGEFDAKAKVGDKQAETQLRCRLLANKKCCITSLGEVPPYPAFTSIDGYDPSAKKWKMTGFDTAGDHWITYLWADAETLKNRERGSLNASAQQIKPDGTVIEWKGKWTYTFADGKIVVFITEQTRNGEKTPDEEYAYTRKN